MRTKKILTGIFYYLTLPFFAVFRVIWQAKEDAHALVYGYLLACLIIGLIVPDVSKRCISFVIISGIFIIYAVGKIYNMLFDYIQVELNKLKVLENDNASLIVVVSKKLEIQKDILKEVQQTLNSIDSKLTGGKHE